MHAIKINFFLYENEKTTIFSICYVKNNKVIVNDLLTKKSYIYLVEDFINKSLTGKDLKCVLNLPYLLDITPKTDIENKIQTLLIFQ